MHRQWVCSIISWRFVEIVLPYEKVISKHICWLILDAGPVYPSLCKSCWWAALKLCLCHRDFGLWGTKRTRSMAFENSLTWPITSWLATHSLPVRLQVTTAYLKKALCCCCIMLLLLYHFPALEQRYVHRGYNTGTKIWFFFRVGTFRWPLVHGLPWWTTHGLP